MGRVGWQAMHPHHVGQFNLNLITLAASPSHKLSAETMSFDTRGSAEKPDIKVL
jgi:hypothetical protein